jgi:leucine dehydrogenase
MFYSHNKNDLQQCLHVIDDRLTGVSWAIAIRSTVLVPAAGGCRFWHYNSYTKLTTDAIRLARGMSYKNALADLPFGGGKAVLRRPAGDFDRQAVFRIFGEAVAALQGKYITVENVGTTIADMRVVHEHSPYAVGLEVSGEMAGGDPSPWTARGVFEATQTAARGVLGFELNGPTVAVQGVGNEGSNLCRLLAPAGAQLIIADIDHAQAAAFAVEYGARHFGIDDILRVDTDILAPCAMGGALNSETISSLSARLICSDANNQLATDADGDALCRRGILYAPDYVVNVGGIINVSAEYLGETSRRVRVRVGQISGRLLTILARAADAHVPPGMIADQLARQLVGNASKREAA